MQLSHKQKKIIDAIIRKAKICCPDRLAAVGVYGSVLTGDTHLKSDLDLMILIDGDEGWKLSSTFILLDDDIGYDLYCTSSEMLKEESECNHAFLSKLMDSKIVYSRDDRGLLFINELRNKVKKILDSDIRFQKAEALLDLAKKYYAETFVSVDKGESLQGLHGFIVSIMNSLMIFNGKYFRRGIKRAVSELLSSGIPDRFGNLILSSIQSKNREEMKEFMTLLLKETMNYEKRNFAKIKPEQSNLRGVYEEIYSNWRNKMYESRDSGDVFSSFMNLASLDEMYAETLGQMDSTSIRALSEFSNEDLEKNILAFEKSLCAVKDEYSRVGMQPRIYNNVDEFILDYIDAGNEK